MRAVIFLLAALAASGLFGCAGTGTVTVKLIALNDFHGNLVSPGSFRASASSPNVPAGGADVLAGHVNELKARNPHHAVVAAGDLIGASPLISALFHDEPTIEAMNRIGLEFNAVGNHEFDEGMAELMRMQTGGCHPSDAHSCKGALVGTPYPFEGARFSFLAANVVHAATHRTVFPAYGIKAFNGVRLAFIGMTLKATPSIVTPSGVAGLRFENEAATVNALVPELRARGVEAIVVLVHEGGFQAQPPSPSDINACAGDLAGTPIAGIVAELDDAVDAVISGHTHAAYICSLPNKRGRRIPVTSANAFGRVLTEMDLTLDTRSGDVLSAAAANRVVDRSDTRVTPVESIKTMIGRYGALVEPIANQVIGSIVRDVTPARNAACGMPAGELIADAQLHATASTAAAQIAFMNPGGVRNPGFVHGRLSGAEAAGDITYGEAFTVQPFGNSLVTMTLSAAQLKELLEQQFGGCKGQTATRVLLPSAGFSVTWNGDAPPCRRIVDAALAAAGGVEQLVSGGAVPSPARTYRVTVNSFLASGGDGFTTLLGGTDLLGGAQDIDALAAYLSAFRRPRPAYDPEAASLGKPRIRRSDAGASCPG